jgi:Zn-dependent M28 family amino/carboxypeptidase
VIVSAHFDHLGRVDGKGYPGADDNASGVAALLEIGRCLAWGSASSGACSSRSTWRSSG